MFIVALEQCNSFRVTALLKYARARDNRKAREIIRRERKESGGGGGGGKERREEEEVRTYKEELSLDATLCRKAKRRHFVRMSSS